MRGEKKKKALRGEIEAGNKLESMYKWKKKKEAQSALVEANKNKRKDTLSFYSYITIIVFTILRQNKENQHNGRYSIAENFFFSLTCFRVVL